MQRLESSEEKDFHRWCVSLGYLCKKMKTATDRGWPDRMVMVSDKIIFIEFKREGKKPTRYQEYIHNNIRMKGFHVYIAFSNKHAQEIVLNETGKYDGKTR